MGNIKLNIELHFESHTAVKNLVINSKINNLNTLYLPFSSIQSLSHVILFATPWTAACQASLSIANPQNSVELMFTELVLPSTTSSSFFPFSSCLQSFPASGSFQISQFFTSGGQSVGSFSFNIRPSNDYS